MYKLCKLRNLFPAKNVNLALSSHFRVVLVESYYSNHVKTLTAAARNGDSAYLCGRPKGNTKKVKRKRRRCQGVIIL